MTTTQLVTGVDFVGMPTRDLEAAVKFYGSTVGLPRSVYIRDRHYAEFETGNLTVSVFDPDKMGLQYSVNPNAIALHVDDVAQARAALEEPPLGALALCSPKHKRGEVVTRCLKPQAISR